MPQSLARPAGSTILKTPVSLFFQVMYEVYRCCESLSNCCKKSHNRRPFVFSSGVGCSPSFDDEVGTADGDLGILEAVGDLISVESSESECDDEADCDLRPRLFRGGGTLKLLLLLEAEVEVGWWPGGGG